MQLGMFALPLQYSCRCVYQVLLIVHEIWNKFGPWKIDSASILRLWSNLLYKILGHGNFGRSHEWFDDYFEKLFRPKGKGIRHYNILRRKVMHANGTNGIFLFALKASFFHYSLTSSAFTLILRCFEGWMRGNISELMTEIAAVSFGYSYIFQSLMAHHLFSFVISLIQCFEF